MPCTAEPATAFDMPSLFCSATALDMPSLCCSACYCHLLAQHESRLRSSAFRHWRLASHRGQQLCLAATALAAQHLGRSALLAWHATAHRHRHLQAVELRVVAAVSLATCRRAWAAWCQAHTHNVELRHRAGRLSLAKVQGALRSALRAWRLSSQGGRDLRQAGSMLSRRHQHKLLHSCMQAWAHYALQGCSFAEGAVDLQGRPASSPASAAMQQHGSRRWHAMLQQHLSMRWRAVLCAWRRQARVQAHLRWAQGVIAQRGARARMAAVFMAWAWCSADVALGAQLMSCRRVLARTRAVMSAWLRAAHRRRYLRGLVLQLQHIRQVTRAAHALSGWRLLPHRRRQQAWCWGLAQQHHGLCVMLRVLRPWQVWAAYRHRLSLLLLRARACSQARRLSCLIQAWHTWTEQGRRVTALKAHRHSCLQKSILMAWAVCVRRRRQLSGAARRLLGQHLQLLLQACFRSWLSMAQHDCLLSSQLAAISLLSRRNAAATPDTCWQGEGAAPPHALGLAVTPPSSTPDPGSMSAQPSPLQLNVSVATQLTVSAATQLTAVVLFVQRGRQRQARGALRALAAWALHQRQRQASVAHCAAGRRRRTLAAVLCAWGEVLGAPTGRAAWATQALAERQQQLLRGLLAALRWHALQGRQLQRLGTWLQSHLLQRWRRQLLAAWRGCTLLCRTQRLGVEGLLNRWHARVLRCCLSAWRAAQRQALVCTQQAGRLVQRRSLNTVSRGKGGGR